MSLSRYVLLAGAGCIAVGLITLPISHGVWDLPFLLGVALLVCSAALVAANGPPGGVREARRATTVAVLVLAALILAPFGVLGLLLVMHADPMAIFWMCLVVFPLAGTLVVLFVVVFFAARSLRRRWSGAAKNESYVAG